MALTDAANLQPNASSDGNAIKSKVVEHTEDHRSASSLNHLQWTLRRVRFSTLSETLASDGLTALQMTRASWSLQVGVRRHTLVVMLPSMVTCTQKKFGNNSLVTNKIKWFQFAQDGADLNERRKVWQLIVWSGQTFSASLQSRLGFDSEKSIHIFKFQQIGFKFVSRQDSQSERQQQEESSEAAVCYLMISRRSCVPWSRSKTHIHLRHLFFFYFFIYLFSPFDPDRVGSPVLSCHFQKIPTLLFLVEFRFIL